MTVNTFAFMPVRHMWQEVCRLYIEDLEQFHGDIVAAAEAANVVTIAGQSGYCRAQVATVIKRESAMPEVVIELNLRRRSGVLAGAVAALRPLTLEFRSQKLADRDGQPQLTLTTEGELADLDMLLEAFSRARGVSEVSDVRVDGQSLMHVPAQPDEPKDAAEAAVETPGVPEKFEDRIPEPEVASNSETSGNNDQDDGFNDDEFARHVLAGETKVNDSKQETRSSERDEKFEPRSRPAERPDPSGSPTSAMVRRRRRRR